MGDHYEVVPLRPKSHTGKAQSKYVSRNQFEKISKERDFKKKISKEISELQSLALLIVRPGQLCGEIDWKMPFPGIILLYFGHFHQILRAH